MQAPVSTKTMPSSRLVMALTGQARPQTGFSQWLQAIEML
jgi:hypothetical protein